jgi:hypothetical protein
MRRLTILGFILGMLVTPVQAQAPAPAGAQIQSPGFNGLFFDKSAPQGYQAQGYQGYQAPYQGPPATRYRPRKTVHHYKSHYRHPAS